MFLCIEEAKNYLKQKTRVKRRFSSFQRGISNDFQQSYSLQYSSEVSGRARGT